MEEFGLPRNFTLEGFEAAQRRLHRQRVRSAWLIAGVGVAGMFVVFWQRFGLSAGSSYALGGVAVAVMFFGTLPWAIAKRCIKGRGWELRFENEVERYSAATREWRYSKTEAGQGFWTALRGIAFEQAIALYFTRRGCAATLTDVTGDGGVDVVLTIGEKTYWCQCKGHAKAIPVSEIRRIAGATLKSKGLALPVIISANGFTKPALTEARELNVFCLDANYFVRHATKRLILEL